MTKEQLASLLKQAADAHHAFEIASGKPDEDWPGWYAEWMLPRMEKPWTADTQRQETLNG